MSQNMETLAIQSILFLVRSVRRSQVISKQTDEKLAEIEKKLDEMIDDKVDSILDMLDKIPD